MMSGFPTMYKLIVLVLFALLVYQLSQVEVVLKDDRPKGLNLVY